MLRRRSPGSPARGSLAVLAAAACLAPIVVSSCTGSPHPAPAAAPARSGIDLAGMDRSVAPGDDFFVHANGTWLRDTEIPADRSETGVGAVLSELTARRTADLIVEAAGSGAPAGSDARKIGDTYASFLDEAAIEAKGLAPLRPALERIEAIGTATELARALGATLRADVDVLNATNLYTPNLFGLWVAQDLDEPSRYAPFLLQGGLGMPDRDYYLSPSAPMAAIRARYLEHVARMLELAGVPDATAKAARVVALERLLAEAHATRADSSDVARGNNHWSRADLAARAPGLDWEAFLGAAGLGKQETFVVWQPGALTGAAALVGSQPLATWKEYLTFHAVARAAPYLTRALGAESFAFHGTTLSGTPRQRDRWKRAVDVTDAALGEAVGRLYVARWFPPSEKARAEAMVRNEIAAFARRIDRLDWMAPATKEKAKAKLAVLKVGVGYPDRWRDYSGLEVVKGDPLGNAERASLFATRQAIARLGQPVDRGEWVMNPQLVNAVNLPAMNAMNFPAAILSPPFFDPGRPEVMDYGSIGSVIGHEISHSFDDQGALFDATGRLASWWTKDDFAHFEASAERLVAQYGAYRPFPDVAVDGKLTVSENIADVAGLAVAYDAYRLASGGKEAPAVGGLSGDQQFFLAFAQSWREKIRDEALRQMLVTDSHAPARYRADTVRNLDAWYAAFAVKPGQKLYLAPGDRVRVW